jgi:hypothetical protein
MIRQLAHASTHARVDVLMLLVTMYNSIRFSYERYGSLTTLSS